MKSIIFDVDGTIWDSTAEIGESWKQVCAKYEVPGDHINSARLKKEFGKLLIDIGRSLFPDLPEKTFLPLLHECTRYQNDWLLEHPPVPYEGIETVFKQLSSRGIPIAIVSNCEAGYIETLLAITGLTPFIVGHLCPGDTGLSKADNIKIAVDRFGMEDAVYVGDTLGDQKACLDAGVPFIYASYGFGIVPDPDYRIDSPEELLLFPFA